MLLSIVGAAKNAGWSVEMVLEAPSDGPHAWHAEFEAAGIPLRFAPAGNRRQLGRWVGELVRESEAPTLLHAHFTTFDVPAVLAERGLPQAEVIWHQHMDLSTRPSIMVRNAIKFGGFGRLTKRILCPAPDTAAAVKRVGGPADRTVFFPNAIDLQRFVPPTPAAREAAREMLGIAAQAKVLLHFGWDWERKGGDVFLRAIGALPEDAAEEPLGLTVTSHPAAERLHAQLGLGARARTEPMRADVQSLFAAADVFVAPSRAEGGTPFAVLEALATGLPVVASDIPGHRYIAEAVSACTVTTGDPAAVAEAIRGALNAGAPLPEEEAGRVRDRLAERFGLPGWTQRLLDVYEAVLAAEAVPASSRRR